MPEQLPLFDSLSLHFLHTTKRHHKLKLTERRVDMLDGRGDPIASITWCAGGKPPTKMNMIKRLIEAYHMRLVQPFGESYDTPDGHVTYWQEELPF